MRAPLEWLRSAVDLPASATPDAVAGTLLRAGFEVEDIHVAPPVDGPLVVGLVLAIDELTEFKKSIRFVTVDVGPGNGPDGGNDPRQVICGATNFRVGDRVVVALPGAVLPGGFAIAARATYGRISDGMICSARELGIGADHDGILVLDADAQVGADARAVVGGRPVDAVLELAVTPDRGYALSIRGLARELAAAYDLPFADTAADPVPARAAEGWPVRIADPTGCSRFVTVRVSGVDPAAPSPYWLRRRLAAAGVRSISLAVDVTNYVMIETGQPLHAFDADRLTGSIVVRRAEDGEKLRTLDGAVRLLTDDDLVVADDTGAISLAGVMGGESTEISGFTRNVVLEAANWDPPVIARAARRHKLPSEASRRFERGVDPAVAPYATELAAALLTRFGGGTVQGRSDVGTPIPVPDIGLPATEPERLTGRPYGPGVATRRLEQVGCRVREVPGPPVLQDAVDDRVADAVADPRADGMVDAVADGVPQPADAALPAGSSAGALLVTPPSWRPDLTRPADLVEEIVRLEGYDTVPSILPVAPAGRGLTATQRRDRRIAWDLAAAGLVEVLSFPFIGDAELDALGLAPDDVRRRRVRLANPLDADRPYLTTTLLTGVLDTAVRNLSRGSRDLALFEIGQVFLPRTRAPRPPALPVDRRPDDAALAVLDASMPNQPRHVAVVLAGSVDRPGWWGAGRAGGWADAIELARRVLRTAGVPDASVRVTPGTQLPWHPGRCAAIRVGDWPLGFSGELHPAVLERLGLPARTAAFELDLDALPERRQPMAPAVSPFPAVNLDVALVVSAATSAAEVLRALQDGGGALLESVRLFDVYAGDQLDAGTVSLAFALVVRAPDRTLTAAEATAVRDDAVGVAAERFGAALRA